MGLKIPGLKSAETLRKHAAGPLYGRNLRWTSNLSFRRLLSITVEGETIKASHVDDVTAACRLSEDNDEAETFRNDIGSKFNYKEKDTSVPAIIPGRSII